MELCSFHWHRRGIEEAESLIGYCPLFALSQKSSLVGRDSSVKCGSDKSTLLRCPPRQIFLSLHNINHINEGALNFYGTPS